MAVLPVVPGPWTDGTSPPLTDLQALAYAVSFISDCTHRPIWHFYKTVTLAVTANTWTTVGYGAIAYDSDGVANNGGATIVTQGYYAVEACLDIAPSATAQTFTGAFLWKAGANNPHFASGTTLQFGARGGNTPSDNLADPAICITDICPNVCYPGDSINPQVRTGNASTLKRNTNDAYNSGRWVANFTGMWVASGS